MNEIALREAARHLSGEVARYATVEQLTYLEEYEEAGEYGLLLGAAVFLAYRNGVSVGPNLEQFADATLLGSQLAASELNQMARGDKVHAV